MFTKTRVNPPPQSQPSQQEAKTYAPSAERLEPNPSNKAGRTATLGPSISISGNLSGDEDLVIEGSVEGEVMVRDHMVTISETGRVKADVYGRSICVEGEVDGNLVGDEQVIIRKSGRVRGNVTAPRVNLENGAKFKGSIDMQPAESAREKVARSGAPAVNKPESSRTRAGALSLSTKTPQALGESA